MPRRRNLDLTEAARRVVKAVRDGDTLHRSEVTDGTGEKKPRWFMGSTGKTIPAPTAQKAAALLEPVDDGLFPGFAQTYRA